MFTVHTVDKELTFRKYKQLITLSIKETTEPKKWSEDLNSDFTKTNIYMVNKHMTGRQGGSVG